MTNKTVTDEYQAPSQWTNTAARLLLAILVVACLVATMQMCGCYNPDLSKVRYTCSITHPLCPGNLECINGVCGGGQLDAPDAGTVPDAGSLSDMAVPSPACARGVPVQLSNNMYGCSGNVVSGDFSDALCKSGRLCRTNDPAAKDPPGFYFAAAFGQQVAPPPLGSKIVAGWNNLSSYQTTTRYLFGRGSGTYTESSPIEVNGFRLAQQCSPQGMSYAGCGWNWGDERDIERITVTGWLCCNF